MHFKNCLVLVAIAAGCGDERLMEVDIEITGGPVGTPSGTSPHTNPIEVVGSVCDWAQNMGSEAHLGKLCPAPHGLRLAAVLTQDPDAAAQAANPDTGPE
jgi:hypothetical protein